MEKLIVVESIKKRNLISCLLTFHQRFSLIRFTFRNFPRYLFFTHKICEKKKIEGNPFFRFMLHEEKKTDVIHGNLFLFLVTYTERDEVKLF